MKELLVAEYSPCSVYLRLVRAGCLLMRRMKGLKALFLAVLLPGRVLIGLKRELTDFQLLLTQSR